MEILQSEITISAYLDELTKLSAVVKAYEPIRRSYAKDFLAGVDPTGTVTYGYGVRDAPSSPKSQLTRKMVGTVGGAVGGALAIPSAISGLIGAGSGILDVKRKGPGAIWHGFTKGLARPVVGTYRAMRARSLLRRAAMGQNLTRQQGKVIQKFIEENKPKVVREIKQRVQAPGRALGELAEQAVGKENVVKARKVVGDIGRKAKEEIAATGAKAREFMESSPSVEKIMENLSSSKITPTQASVLVRKITRDPTVLSTADALIQSRIRQGLSALGLSGAVSGASAAYQYGKGGRMGSILTPEQRAKLMAGTTRGNTPK